MVRKQNLANRVRELETHETAMVQVGRGIPDHRAGALTFYLDQRTRKLYVCIGGTSWREVSLSQP